jgi:RNA-binding protein
VNPNLKKQLKAKAHALSPVVTIGTKGYTDAVAKELDLALEHHELLKVKVQQQEKQAIKHLAATIETSLDAELITIIGKVMVLYRRKKTEPTKR